jgi:hypothetical protein
MEALRNLDPIYLFIAGSAVGTWVLLRRSGRLWRSRRRNVEHLELRHRPANAWDGAHKDAEAMIERQKVELYELARDVTGRIDSKMILLQQLMAQGDQQIERLEALLAVLNECQPAAENAAFARG